MYLGVLDYEDKKRFFALASRLVSVDGDISDEEIGLLEAYRNEMNLLDVDSMSDLEIEEIVNEVTENSVVKKIFIYELLTLSYVDSDYSDEEKRYMKSIKEMFDISDDIFASLENLVKRMVDTTNSVTEIIMSNDD